MTTEEYIAAQDRAEKEVQLVVNKIKEAIEVGATDKQIYSMLTIRYLLLNRDTVCGEAMVLAMLLAKAQNKIKELEESKAIVC